MTFYLDTSAAAKLVVEEAESDALARWADDTRVTLVATTLLETELRRFAVRHGLPQSAATLILDRVSLHDLAPSGYHEAGVLPGAALRSLDALHLVGAMRLRVEALVTYDVRLAEAAGSVGIDVLAPAAG